MKTFTVPASLIKWVIENKKETLLRDYLRFRAIAMHKGSYGGKPDNLTHSAMRRLEKYGWVKKVNKGHYQMVSVWKIAISLELNINARTKVSADVVNNSSGDFKSYILSKGEAWLHNRNVRAQQYKNRTPDRDGVKTRGAQIEKLVSIQATRYAGEAFSLSASTVSLRRKSGYNKYIRQYCQDFDSLNIKSRKKLEFYLEGLKFSDLTEREKEARRNIVWDKKLKKYRVVTSTKIIFTDPIVYRYERNRSAANYKKRYSDSPNGDCVASLPIPL